MRDMSVQYKKAAREALALPERARSVDLPFRLKGESLTTVFGAGEMPEPGELRACPVSELSLDPGKAPWLAMCRRQAAACGKWALLDVRDTDVLLDQLEKTGNLSPGETGLLRAFLAMRPCFFPAMRPGLGLLLRTHSNGGADMITVVPRLLEGYGQAPEGFYFPLAMNLELTTQCPLRCPQCYCHLQEGRHMAPETAACWLRQAGELGVNTVNLSGGETMCYPWLTQIIRCARENGLEPDVALSGYGVNDEKLSELIDAGVNGIYVSLNGPTREINARTRDGYNLAIRLLERLRDRDFENTWINWVVHISNAGSLPEMAALAERMHVKGIMIMAFKPDSSNALPSLPTRRQMEDIARFIRIYDGPVELCVESCYSSLRCLAGARFWGCSNTGPFRGCGAGRDSFSVGLDGRLSPCRHVELFEETASLAEYWAESPVLKGIRSAQHDPQPPCRGCRFQENCLHCMAVNLQLRGELTRGDATCPLAAQKEG